MKSFVLVCLLFTLSACTAYTHMNRISYKDPAFNAGGSVYVVSTNKATNNSLEFKHFKPYIENALQAKGFTPVQSMKSAKYIAVIHYGIDNGRTKVVSTPVYGYDAFNRYSVIIPGYPAPGYAIAGINTVEYEEFTHVLSMEILQAKSAKSSERKEVYASKVISKNLCPYIGPVFPDLVQGLFENFPARNGETKEVKVKTSKDCQQ